MGTKFEKTLMSWEIDNFSEEITLSHFSCGDFEWYVSIYPERYDGNGHLNIFLYVVNPKPPRLGWKRRAIYSFVLLNQSGKELLKSPDLCGMFCAEAPGWGFLLTEKLQQKGFLDKDQNNHSSLHQSP
ncbi:unnamed protein product [Thlaspi arvense]|uniref:MATH domain-containing protein n=1 Tax=Thlaspi arvense TaxID=13288 RepID=A0AAU9RJC5_THLAR|nr:unnamed protein product [Thlaspi arvense]